MIDSTRKPSRIQQYDYSQAGSYFLTICTQDRKQILSLITEGPTVTLLRYGMIAERYIQQLDSFYTHLSVDKFIIMPDHIHLLITIFDDSTQSGAIASNGNSAIAKFVSTFKRFCNKEYGKNIWQGRYYDHVIRNQQDYNETWEYIDGNPMKWLLTHDPMEMQKL